MKQVKARAPGKAVLLGEYAVTLGAPALAMAVDRRAYVNITPCDPGSCTLSAPQLGVHELGFMPQQGGRLGWDVDHPGWPAVARTASLLGLLHKLATERFGDPGPYQVEIDTGELFVQHQGRAAKLGLGSSSAVAVALDAALRCLCSGSSRSGLSIDALQRLLKPYRRGQDGRGSGIDLATSLCGGIIGYQRQGEALDVTRLSLPADISMMLVWTGKQASTTHLLAAFDTWRERAPGQSERLLASMQACCGAGLQALTDGDSEALVRQFSVYGQLMGTMGELMGAEVVTPALAEIMEQASRFNVACKPSGAGGGDLALLASAEPGGLHELRGWLESRDLLTFIPGIDDQGVHADWTHPA